VRPLSALPFAHTHPYLHTITQLALSVDIFIFCGMSVQKPPWTVWSTVIFLHGVPTATSIMVNSEVSLNSQFQVQVGEDMITYSDPLRLPKHPQDNDLMDVTGPPAKNNYPNMSKVSRTGPAFCGAGYYDTCEGGGNYWKCGLICPRGAPWTHGSCSCCCEPDSTPHPTPYPTDPPAAPGMVGAMAGAPAPSIGVFATGDPHLQNVHGEKFDLLQPGKHLLIQIPRKRPENTLLRVDAEAAMMGGQCSDMYFQVLNITGKWAEGKRTGGFRYHAQDVDRKPPHWVHFGTVLLKVAHGCTHGGINYLNFYVRDLVRAGFEVGGLLGDGDHTEAAVPLEECVHRMAL